MGRLLEGGESGVDRGMRPFRHTVGSDRLRGLEAGTRTDSQAAGRQHIALCLTLGSRKDYATGPVISMLRQIVPIGTALGYRLAVSRTIIRGQEQA